MHACDSRAIFHSNDSSRESERLLEMATKSAALGGQKSAVHPSFARVARVARVACARRTYVIKVARAKVTDELSLVFGDS
jgi:hypothetical protein